MAFPERGRIKDALLSEIRRQGGRVKPKDVYEVLADHFRLSPSDRDRVQENGGSRWENEVRWAKQELADEGKIDRSTYGVWRLK
jgi:restriction system protein